MQSEKDTNSNYCTVCSPRIWN